jgi:KOW motif
MLVRECHRESSCAIRNSSAVAGQSVLVPCVRSLAGRYATFDIKRVSFLPRFAVNSQTTRRALGAGIEPNSAHQSTNQRQRAANMNSPLAINICDGDHCTVVAGTHKGKSGRVRDINTSKTGAVTITVVQSDGERFKTLAKNVTLRTGLSE